MEVRQAVIGPTAATDVSRLKQDSDGVRVGEAFAAGARSFKCLLDRNGQPKGANYA